MTEIVIDWSTVKSEHVIQACNLYDAEKRLPVRMARNTFLLYRDKKYPAKFIRGLAYEFATNQKLNPNLDYEGGKQTANFFLRLGFPVEYKGKIISPNIAKGSLPVTSQSSSDSKTSYFNPVSQKYALKKLLEKQFGLVQTEAKFDWLIVPERHSMDGDLARIVDALTHYRGFKNFYNPQTLLQCDYYIPEQNLIVEYDERQHFTIPRGISLSLYPADLTLGFDVQVWRKACRSIQARDNDPIFRDEQRAFYDSLRDILAIRNGYFIVRIKHGDYDWKSKAQSQTLKELLFKYKDPTH